MQEAIHSLPHPSTYQNGYWFFTIGLLSIMFFLVLPLSPSWIDWLVVINLVGALTLLIASLTIAHPLELSSLPSLLLGITLFRLGLNISSARLILSEGMASPIMEKIGNLSTQNNLAAGFLVFIINAIMQFVIVSKGCERVAEVAARFNLDALPGRQMSIDADLRAGMINSFEAQSQRQELQKESRFFGAMDGSIKFIKGDAIIGFIILGLNLSAGILTGILSFDMSPGKAFVLYSTFVIGDGLCTQIPSMMTALAAALFITRVSDSKSQNSIGEEISRELLSKPRILSSSALVCVVLGFLPILPGKILFPCAAFLYGSSLWFQYKNKQLKKSPKHLEDFLIDSKVQSLPSPFVLEISPTLYQYFENSKGQEFFNQECEQIKMELEIEYGLKLPMLNLAINSQASDQFTYTIKVFDIPSYKGFFTPFHQYALNEPLLLEGEKSQKILTHHGTPLYLLDKKEERTGIPIQEANEILKTRIKKIWLRYAHRFLGIQETKELIRNLEKSEPELIREVVPKLISYNRLTDLLKRLVEEEIPIKNLKQILEAIALTLPDTKDPVSLTETIRTHLKDLISYRYQNSENAIPVILLDDSIEDEIRKAIIKRETESYLALPLAITEQILSQFKAKINKQSPLVILTHMDIRRYVRKLIEHDFPHLAVLSFQELEPNITIKEKIRINLRMEAAC
ncbi:MAG: hypothetical protein A3G32_05035 [Deltaproteobacteria bacterium RIFCSPLOWO2_12_FULL_40_28]|nr:MAG: hypothetical protein A3C45_09145 [Deltaproteobacteria bacterium RIFCSPHIGHO2_02_FULL_40_28]OGQ19729.1 MAG: hypothetical protein A3E27_08340 [Deltaproteobacteria bacterium RIFCSPHIGHO2_12_FULL_40_32]OGQ41006.1 MAG: hypothetical protein A3I69_03755 [Deltaproteobacteria bacterium RIFCSPLOWO2_02_FULL_40_36]OGQ54122.1 MAG: hypothetical protein A3G32_05035 [Deltaproteobacteria bacterium RIFCSPLOWO2_12_FULL_40_28]